MDFLDTPQCKSGYALNMCFTSLQKAPNLKFPILKQISFLWKEEVIHGKTCFIYGWPCGVSIHTFLSSLLYVFRAKLKEVFFYLWSFFNKLLIASSIQIKDNKIKGWDWYFRGNYISLWNNIVSLNSIVLKFYTYVGINYLNLLILTWI